MSTNIEAARKKLEAAEEKYESVLTKLYAAKKKIRDKEAEAAADRTFDPKIQREARDRAALRNEHNPPWRPDFGGRRRTRRGRKSRSTRRS